MNKLKFLQLHIIPALFSGAALLYFEWPLNDMAIVIALASVPIVLLLSRKRVPLFLFGVLILSIGYAVQDPAYSFFSIGTYFLLSIFQFSLWSAADQIKQLGEEVDLLKEQHQSLLQRTGELKVLTLQEFVEQALWMLKTNNEKERTWLMEVVPAIDCPGQIEGLERAALGSIARERDLVTSRHGAVYILAKETDKDSLQPLMERLAKAVDADDQSAGYAMKKTAIADVCEMGSLLS